MSALALAVLLSLVSAVAYAGGAIVQEWVAAAGAGPQYAPLRRPAWWASVGLNGLGGVLHVAALAFGPLSLVQPLGALTIVFALPMAALFVRRKAAATAWRGAVMATVGLAGLLALTGASDNQSLSGSQRLVVALVTAGSIAALMLAARVLGHRPAVRSVLLATASGAAFGIASVFTKTVALDWSGGSTLLVLLPTLGVTGVMAVAGLLLSQASYRGAGLAAPLSTLTVVNPVVAAAVGLTLFGESFRYGTTGALLALGCGVITAGGLVLLTTERIRSAASPAGDRAVPAPAGEERPLSGDVPQPVPAQQGTAPAATARGPQQPGPVLEDLERMQREERLPALKQLPGVREVSELDDLSGLREGPQRSTLPRRLPHQSGGAERSASGRLAPCGRLRS